MSLDARDRSLGADVTDCWGGNEDSPDWIRLRGAFDDGDGVRSAGVKVVVGVPQLWDEV